MGDTKPLMKISNPPSAYTATITKGGICIRECRIVADLLMAGVDATAWRRAIVDENRLQKKSLYTARTLARVLRARIEPLGHGIWEMIRDGDRTQSTQAVMAGAVKHSRLLGDFMDLVIREQRALFAKKLSASLWNEYIAGCLGRDPEMPTWSETTVTRLRSSVFSILAESGYLSNTRTCELQRVFLDGPLVSYLKENQERYILRCLEVME